MARLRTAIDAGTRSRLAAVAIASTVTAGLAVYIISPRFGTLVGPSLTDDWHMIYSSVTALHQLEHFGYDPATLGAASRSPRLLGDVDRYRPAFWLWSYLQWHTFGAPYFMRGPNAWNVLRVSAFAGALASLAAVALRADRRRQLRPLFIGLLVAIPGFLILSTSAFGGDLTGFGPQEPLMVAALGLGGLALLCAVWLVMHRPVRVVAIALLVVAGFVLWVFGLYMKEASVCMFVFLPFLLLELRARWTPRAWTRRTAIAVCVIALLALAPLVQLTYEVAHLTSQPTLYYGSPAPHGLGQWITRLESSVSQQWNGIPTVFGQSLWQSLAMALPALLLAVWLRTRRPPWLALGLLVLGWSFLAYQGVAGVVASRYYIPVFSCFTVALVVLLAELPQLLSWATLATVAILALTGIPDAHRVAEGWVAGEALNQRLVDTVAALDPRRCPVYYAEFALEQSYSLPIVLALHPSPSGACAAGQATLVLAGESLPPSSTLPLVATCATPGWELVEFPGSGAIYTCARLLRSTVTLPDGSREPVSRVLAPDRLVIPKAAWTP
jgi:hypothetical protein